MSIGIKQPSSSNFEIKDYSTEYIPIKINQINFSNNKPYVKKTYVFVGETNEQIKKILLNISNNKSSDPIKLLSKTDKKALEDHFTEDWKSLLGIENSISNNNSQYQYGGDKTESANQPDDDHYNEPEEDFSNFDANKYKIKDNNADSVEEDIMELIKQVEEKENIESNILNQVIQQNIEEINIFDNKNAKVLFIFEYINKNDSIQIIKNKIFAYTGINYIQQHIFYIRENPILQSDYENINLEFSITLTKNKISRYTHTNILTLFNHNQRTIEGIPIDEQFINLYEKQKIFMINDQSFKLLLEYSQFNNIIYLIDFLDIIPQDNIKLQQIIRNPLLLQEFYYGFVVKYWPGIVNSNNSLIALMLNTYTSIQTQLSILKDINILETQYKSILTIDADKLSATNQINVLSVIIHINFSNENVNKKLLNLRNLFDLFETNNDIPYIKYKLKDYRKIISKVYKPFYDENINLIQMRWSNIDPFNNIIMKMYIPTNNKYININIYDDFRIRIDANWEEKDFANVKEIKEIVAYVNEYIIDKINKLNDTVFYTHARIKRAISDNVRIINLNVSKVIANKKYSIYNYQQLVLLTKLYNNFIVLDNTRKIDFEKNPYSIYWRFMKTSKLVTKQIKTTSNEVLSNLQEQLAYIKGVDVHIIDEIPKIIIFGGKGIDEINRIYNFIERFLYIFENINELIKKPEFNFIKPIYGSISSKIVPKNYNKGKNDENENENENIPTSQKKIRKLQKIDPTLFDFDTIGNKFQFYSRTCQGNDRQPIVVENEADIKDKSRLLKFENKTYVGEIVNYYCDNKIYKYPGFFSKDKHPSGLCLPCCFKNNFLDTKNSSKYLIYKQCMREQSPSISLSINNQIVENLLQTKYIKQWGKQLNSERFGMLPSSLNKLFNDEFCKINNLNQLDKNTKCLVVYGILQDHYSLFRAVAIALTENKWENIGFINNMIDYLNKNTYVFPLLENGAVLQKFKTLTNYINYINDKNIDEIYFIDLLSKYNYLEPDGINLIIFEEKDEDEIFYKCNKFTTKLINNLTNTNKKTIILIKNEIKKLYFPIFEIISNNNNLTINRTFNKDSITIIKLISFIKSICGINTKHIQTDLFKQKYGIDQMYTAAEMIHILTNNEKKYHIAGQILDTHGILINYLVIHDNKESSSEFVIPVKKYSTQENNISIKVLTKGNLGNFNEITKFIKNIITDKFNINIKKYIILQKNIVGIMLTSNYIINIIPFDATEIIKANNIPIMYIEQPINKINDILLEKNEFSKEIIENTNIIRQSENIYNIFILEVAKYLFSEVNHSIRNKINKLLHIEPGNYTGELYRSIMKKINNMNEINEHDKLLLQSVIYTIFNTQNNKILDEYRFEFDKITSNKINEIISSNEINQYKVNKIEKLLYSIMESSIFIKDNIINNNNIIIKENNLIQTCSNQINKDKCSVECYWSNNKCKLIMTKYIKDQYFTQLAYEIVENDIIRSEILNNLITDVKNYDTFIEREFEIILSNDVKKST